MISKQRATNRIFNFKEFNKYKDLRLIFILPLLDVISTILFTSKIGISYESNYVGRYLMSNLGGWAFVLMYLFAVISILIVYRGYIYLIDKFYNKKKIKISKELYDAYSRGIFIGSLIGMYIMVLYFNIGALL